MLGDEVDLLDPARRQGARLLDQVGEGTRAVLAAEERDGAEVAGVVAALGDLQEGEVRGGELAALVVAEAVLGDVREVLAHHRREAVVVLEGDPLVDLGHVAGQLAEGALGAADGDEQLGPGLAAAGGVQDVADRLLLGALDEAAGVDQHQIGLGELVGEAEIDAAQGGDQVLAVGEVLGAAEADEGGGARGHGAGINRRMRQKSTIGCGGCYGAAVPGAGGRARGGGGGVRHNAA